MFYLLGPNKCENLTVDKKEEERSEWVCRIEKESREGPLSVRETTAKIADTDRHKRETEGKTD